MTPFDQLCLTSVSPHAAHFHVSMRMPCIAKAGFVAACEETRLTAGCPQAAQISPCCTGVTCSRAFKRSSSASSRAGASLIFFHSPHLSRAASKSERNDNVLS